MAESILAMSFRVFFDFIFCCCRWNPTLMLLILCRANEKALRISGRGEERDSSDIKQWYDVVIMQAWKARNETTTKPFMLSIRWVKFCLVFSYLILLPRLSNDNIQPSFCYIYKKNESWWKILKNETCHIPLHLTRLLIVATLQGNYSWIYCFELKSRSKEPNFPHNTAQRTSWRVLMWIINYGKCPEAFSVTRTNRIILSDWRTLVFGLAVSELSRKLKLKLKKAEDFFLLPLHSNFPPFRECFKLLFGFYQKLYRRKIAKVRLFVVESWELGVLTDSLLSRTIRTCFTLCLVT